MKIIISIIWIAISSFAVNAQLNGIVLGSDNNKQTPIYGAKIQFLQSDVKAITSEEGKFSIILPKILPDTMVVKAMGFYSDTVICNKNDRFRGMEIILYSDQLLPEVVASAKKSSHSISRLNTLHVEYIGEGELRKAACCNLSESFETNASVDVNITDAVSGAKKIQMMGLDGVYTQIQLENIPFFRGLESAFGLNSMPGTWIESMQVTKGTGTVVNGYESMAGLINLEVKKPQSMEKLFVNGYVNGRGRSEINVHAGLKLNDKWSTGFFVHGAINPLEIDYNKDGFKDIPTGYNLALMNRYHYQGKKMEAQIGVNAYVDSKEGGQLSDRKDLNAQFYGVNIDSRHISLFAKTGFFLKKPGHSIGVVYNAKYQTLSAQFGDRKFNGTETRGYINAIYDGIIGNTNHKYKLGVSGVVSNIEQELDSLDDNRLEIVPGVFGEYTYTGLRISVVGGVRADYHNLFGFQFSPRLHTKFIITEYTDLRITGGKGWRVPNYMIDNVSLLANSKPWILNGEIKPEVSWNFGGSIVQRFKLGKRTASISVDYYHTLFENQMIVDRDAAQGAIEFGNLNGRSFSHALQTEVSLPISKTVELRLAYKYLEVKAEFGGELQQKVMVPNHRGFLNLGYKTRNKRWEFDLTASVFGEARLPVVMMPDGNLTTKNRSEVYPMLSAQVTHKYKNWDFYIGGENLTNYTQKNPIIDAENPFSNDFDATRIWAPVIGINVYAGFRYSLKKKD